MLIVHCLHCADRKAQEDRGERRHCWHNKVSSKDDEDESGQALIHSFIRSLVYRAGQALLPVDKMLSVE